MEHRKDVVGFEGLYEVSDLGKVRNAKTLRALKPQVRQHGYLSVWLYGETTKQKSIHRMVAEAFCPNPNKKSEVNHKNEDKTDNRAENLEWVTHKENSQYGTRPMRIGSKHHNGKLSRAIEQYSFDGKLIATYESLAEAERQTGYAKGNICRCAKGDPKYSHAYGFLWRYKSFS